VGRFEPLPTRATTFWQLAGRLQESNDKPRTAEAAIIRPNMFIEDRSCQFKLTLMLMVPPTAGTRNDQDRVIRVLIKCRFDDP
jgi:hypothetical protein